MNFRIIEERRNDLMKRTEVFIEINHEKGATPSKEEVRKNFAAKNSLDIEKVEIVYVKSKFGEAKSKAYIRIWDEKKDYLTVKEEKQGKNEEEKEVE